MTSWIESTHTSLKRLYHPLAFSSESHCGLAYPVSVFQPFRVWFHTQGGLREHQVPRTKQSPVTDSSGLLALGIRCFTMVQKKACDACHKRKVRTDLGFTGSISSLYATGLCPNRSGTSLGAPALRLHAADVTLEMYHIMLCSWLILIDSMRFGRRCTLQLVPAP